MPCVSHILSICMCWATCVVPGTLMKRCSTSLEIWTYKLEQWKQITTIKCYPHQFSKNWSSLIIFACGCINGYNHIRESFARPTTKVEIHSTMADSYTSRWETSSFVHKEAWTRILIAHYANKTTKMKTALLFFSRSNFCDLILKCNSVNIII